MRHRYLQSAFRYGRPSHAGRAVSLVLLVLLIERPAAAYTDPGTGTLIWQILVAGLVGVSFYFRKITSVLKRRKQNRQDSEKKPE